MSILLTGSEGFIGKNLLKILNRDTICCDIKNDYGNIKALDYISREIETNKKIRTVYHLGAISSTTEQDVSLISRYNIDFSCRILEACIRKNINFVYASSASVYGLGDYGFHENAILSPLNYYAISKACFDKIVEQKICDNPGSKIVGLRYFNVYGNGEDKKGDMASPVHKFLKSSIKEKEIRIFEGSERFSRDFIHVDDVVDITKKSVNFKSGIYNVGTGTERTFLDIAKIISNLSKSKIIEVPFPSHLYGKYQKFTKSENRKINNEGYSKNRIDLKSGILNVFKNI